MNGLPHFLHPGVYSNPFFMPPPPPGASLHFPPPPFPMNFAPSSLTEDYEDSKKIYYCQRCENHEQRALRRNHKNDCPFRLCKCDKCLMVDKRSQLNSQLKSHEQEDLSMEEDVNASEGAFPSVSTSRAASLGSGGSGDESERDSMQLDKSGRHPCCQRCRAHGMKRPLKNHKRRCPWKDCTCPKCGTVEERRRLMAEQIKLRRYQKKQREEQNKKQRKEEEEERARTAIALVHSSPPFHPNLCVSLPSMVGQCASQCNNYLWESQLRLLYPNFQQRVYPFLNHKPPPHFSPFRFPIAPPPTTIQSPETTTKTADLATSKEPTAPKKPPHPFSVEVLSQNFKKDEKSPTVENKPPPSPFITVT